MKKFFSVFLCFLFCISILSTALCQSPLATVSAVKGDVKIYPGDGISWFQVQPGMSLYDGDRIVTGGDGLVAIAYSDGSQFKVNINSDLKITFPQEGSNKSFIDLIVGEIWLLVNPGGNDVQVNTPAAVAGVEGTEFNVNFSDEHCTVTVLEGKVKLSNDRGCVTLKESMQCSLGIGDEPAEEKLVWVDAEEVVKWAAQVE